MVVLVWKQHFMSILRQAISISVTHSTETLSNLFVYPFSFIHISYSLIKLGINFCLFPGIIPQIFLQTVHGQILKI